MLPHTNSRPTLLRPPEGTPTYIILYIEVTASLQQNLHHRKMTLIGSKMQGGPAMLLMQKRWLVLEQDPPSRQDTEAKKMAYQPSRTPCPYP